MYSINTKSNSADIQARKEELESRVQRSLQLVFESQMGVAEARVVAKEAEEMLARVKFRKQAKAYFARVKSRPEARV